MADPEQRLSPGDWDRAVGGLHGHIPPRGWSTAEIASRACDALGLPSGRVDVDAVRRALLHLERLGLVERIRWHPAIWGRVEPRVAVTRPLKKMRGD